MVHQFLKIHIAVPDFDVAVDEFSVIARALGLTYSHHGWNLSNTRLQLEAGTDTQTRISGLTLAVDSSTQTPELTRGLKLVLQPGEPADIPTDTVGIDHVVLQTADADGCMRLFRDQLGIRLALDQTVEEWGGRMLFFRAGKMTLEVIENASDRPQQDFFWGLTYLCPDIDKSHADLTEAGVSLSELRAGRKPGTRVATLKSHTLGIPSLLVGPGESGR
ncbi:MAG: VOC family protein [Halioglobus sp.]